MNAIFETHAVDNIGGRGSRISHQAHLEDAICEYFKACNAQQFEDKIPQEKRGHPKLVKIEHHTVTPYRDAPPQHYLTLRFEHPCINATIRSIRTTPIQ